MPANSPTPALSAQEVISVIQQNLGITWNERTVDTFKTGDPGAAVTGIAVSMMPTIDVLQRAVGQGCNLVIAHEPLFFNHPDSTAELESEGDAVYRVKRQFIEEHGLIIWRFHDHWHMRQPDGILEGMTAALGWEPVSPERKNFFLLPATTLEQLARELNEKLDVAVIRVIGDPHAEVTRAALSPGFSGFSRHRELLQDEELEVLVIGEAHEWETIAYVGDAVDAGLCKALIILGHTPSEQAGMEWFVHWLQPLVPDVPVHYIPAREPFWTLK